MLFFQIWYTVLITTSKLIIRLNKSIGEITSKVWSKFKFHFIFIVGQPQRYKQQAKITIISATECTQNMNIFINPKYQVCAGKKLNCFNCRTSSKDLIF